MVDLVHVTASTTVVPATIATSPGAVGVPGIIANLNVPAICAVGSPPLTVGSVDLANTT